MSRIDDLKQQAARAERLARQALDNLTVERLRQAARDYLAEAEQPRRNRKRARRQAVLVAATIEIGKTPCRIHNLPAPKQLQPLGLSDALHILAFCCY